MSISCGGLTPPPGPVPEDSREFPSAWLRLDRTLPVGFHDGIEPHSGKLILQAAPGQYLLKLNFLFSTE